MAIAVFCPANDPANDFYQQITNHGNPNLRFTGIWGSSDKRLYLKIFLTLSLKFRHHRNFMYITTFLKLRHNFGCRNEIFAIFAACLYVRNQINPEQQVLLLSKKEQEKPAT